MNLEENILIERYISDDLTDLERSDFLRRLEEDIEFAKRVKLEQQMFDSFNEERWSDIKDTKSELIDTYKDVYRSKEIRDLNSKLQTVNKQYQASKKTKIIRLMLFTSAAAAILILVINTFFVSYTSQELYNDTIDLNNLPSFVSREDANENELVKAQLLFEEKAYDKAVMIFEKELGNAQNEKNASIYLYTGVSQMELADFEKAESTFERLISSDLIDAEKGKWYKALLFIKMERIEESKTILEEIVASTSYNSKEASKLLKKLSKIKTQ